MFAPSYKEQLTKDLKPYQRNARTHSKAQVDKIVKSINNFGFTNPIITDEHGMVIAGHGRLMAAKQLKLITVPTMVVAGLNDQMKRALIIADNKLALDAGWDLELLHAELMELNTPDFDFALTGFNISEALDILLDTEDDLSDEQDKALNAEIDRMESNDLIQKCKELLKRDKGFTPIVNERHNKLRGNK